MTGRGYDTPILELFKECDLLSVNQLIAFTTLKSIFKIKHSGEPKYLAERLGQRDGIATNRNQHNINVNFRLARGQEGILYRGSKLWNSLDISLKTEEREIKFKKKTKIWVMDNIPLIPF